MATKPGKTDAAPSLAPDEDPPHAADTLDYSEDEVDESLDESFPASDPPSWAGMLRIGKPKR
jgi:hypothetical protein